MKKRDYYEILGIERTADNRTIKQAYRKLAMEFHPDRNPDDSKAEDSFKEAAEAYEILSNPEKRKLYDQFGHEGLTGQNTGFSGMEDIFSHFGDIFSDFFGGDIFGSRGRASRPPRTPRGSDMRVEAKITFEESFKGTKKELELVQRKTCSKCEGTGSEPGTEPAPCSTCNGHGQVVQRTGFMTMVTTCPDCHGKGNVIVSPCRICEGTGREPFTRKVTANVPAGVDSGMRLRIAGEGEKIDDGEPGDLYVFIRVEEHDRLSRDQEDLHYQIDIPFTRAILGHTFTLEIVDEEVEIELPAGIQPGDVVTVSGKGMPIVGRKERGDLHVTARVELPTELTSEQRELVEKLDRTV